MKILIATNIASHYRKNLWENMLVADFAEISFAFGVDEKNTIKQIDNIIVEFPNFPNRLYLLKNIYFLNILLWQRNILSRILWGDFDCYILNGDMYTVTNWIGALLAKLRRKKVIFWGHGIYGNENLVKLFFRKIFLKISDYNLLYGRRGREIMIEKGFDPSKLIVFYNSISDRKLHQRRLKAIEPNFYKDSGLFKNPVYPTVLYLGRLVQSKRVDILIEAIKILKMKNAYCNLIIVGSGPCLGSLMTMSNDLSGQVHFFGECYDESLLGRLIANADIVVSPGNVGLLAIHSMLYGTPVCTHGDLSDQMPEFEAIVPGATGCFFKFNDCESLAESLWAWLNHNLDRKRVREACYKVVDDDYNSDRQLDILANIVRELKG